MEDGTIEFIGLGIMERPALLALNRAAAIASRERCAILQG